MKNENEELSQMFIDNLVKDVTAIYKEFKNPKKVTFTADDKKNFEEVRDCHICCKE